MPGRRSEQEGCPAVGPIGGCFGYIPKDSLVQVTGYVPITSPSGPLFPGILTHMPPRESDSDSLAAEPLHPSCARPTMANSVAHAGFFCMGTRCHIVVSGVPQEEADPLIRMVKKELERVEDLLSWFRPHSEISRINREAPAAETAVDEELMDLLLACRDAHRRTGGAFDPTLRPLADEPDPDRRLELLAEFGMRHVRLDPDRGTVRFDSPRIRLDAGGFGKGYALDRAAEIVRRCGFRDALLSLGESSITGIGSHPAGSGWPVGIRDARHPNRLAGEFRLRNASVCTSGTFQTGSDGTPRPDPHILNPRTSQHVRDLLTVSCMSGSAMEAEFWSTALLVLPFDEWRALEGPSSDLQAQRFAYSDPAGPPDCSRHEWPSRMSAGMETDKKAEAPADPERSNDTLFHPQTVSAP